LSGDGRSFPGEPTANNYLETLLNALTLRRNGCGDWCIKGKHGQIFADGKSWLIVVATDESSRRWTNVTKRLSFCRVTQEGDEAHFRQWHKADVQPSPGNVRFWG
jgi:hypothetical protein